MARYYNPQTGRYLTPDPIGLEGGINPYGYVDNNPVNAIDPLGLISWKGSSLQVSAVSLVGGTFIRYELESECINGKKAKIIVWAVGPSGGIGAKATATWSPAQFEDYDSMINVGNFNGLFMGVSAGITGHLGVPIRPPGNSILPGNGPGVGLSGSYVRLGSSFSNITNNPGIIVGYDKSITGTIGSSTVVESKIVDCCEGK